MKNKKIRDLKPPIDISKGNVLDDLGFTPEECALVKLKAELHSEILKAIKERELTPRKLERALHEPQPRISELLNGKISKISVDKLTTYLFFLGKKTHILTKSRALTAEEKERLAA